MAAVLRAALFLCRQRAGEDGPFVRFDGDQKVDLIKGLGIAFNVPFHEEIQNRHVRLGGEKDGLWSEAGPAVPRRAGGRRGRPDYARQVAGEKIRPRGDECSRSGRIGSLCQMERLPDHPAQRGWVRHRKAHQSAKLLAGRAWPAGGRGTGFRGRRLSGGLAVGPEELLAVLSGIARSAQRHQPTPPRCTSGSGRPTRRRWTCATTTRARTDLDSVLRRRAARLQHAARRRAHQRDDAVSFAAPFPARPIQPSRRWLAQAPPLLAAPPPQYMHAARRLRHLEPARPLQHRQRRRSKTSSTPPSSSITRKWTSATGTASGITATSCTATTAAARVALRHRRLRLGQHRTGHRHVALVHASCAPAAPTSSAWRKP